MDEEIIFEFVTIGNYVRVTAFHPPTHTEVFTTCPSHLSPHDMQAHALRKLKWVMAKNKAPL